MVEGFDPIEPCEPLVPEPTPIEVVPGPVPTRPPLIQPSSEPLKISEIPPTPTIRPDPEPEGSGEGDGDEPPNGPPIGPLGSEGDDPDGNPNGGDRLPGRDPRDNPPRPLRQPPDKIPPPTKPGEPPKDDGDDDEPPTKPEPQRLRRTRLRVAQCVFEPVDSISQYNSFRSGNSRRHRGRPFGIDISLDGYSCYVATLRAEHPGHHEDDYRRAAWYFIWHHQRFHYRVDCAVFALERAFDIAGKPLSSSVWQQFHILVGGSPNRCSALEESLSCAFALRQCKNQLSHELTLTLVRKQPKAYQQQTDDGKYILTAGARQTYQEATSQLLSRYLDLQLRSPFYAANLHTLLTDNNPFGWRLKPYLAR